MAKLVGAREVADQLGLPTWKVYGMARDGALPSVKLGAKSVRFDMAQIDAFVKNGGVRHNENATP